MNSNFNHIIKSDLTFPADSSAQEPYFDAFSAAAIEYPNWPETPLYTELDWDSASSNLCLVGQQTIETLTLYTEAGTSQRSGLIDAGTEKSENTFVKMTGREKKLFKAAIAKGLPREAALAAAKAPRAETQVKRGRSDDGDPEACLPKKPKNTYSETAALSNRRIGCSVKLGFASIDRSLPLTLSQMATLKAAILEATRTCMSSVVRPHFQSCLPRTDWLMLVCADHGSADWVRNNFMLIRAKSALDVELLEEGEFPQGQLIRGYFPNSFELSNETILEYIDAQNEVSTGQWKVVERSTNGSVLQLAIMVDDASMQKLVKCGGKIWYCFGKTRLILKNTVSKDEVSVNGLSQATATTSFRPTTAPARSHAMRMAPNQGSVARNRYKPPANGARSGAGRRARWMPPNQGSATSSRASGPRRGAARGRTYTGDNRKPVYQQQRAAAMGASRAQGTARYKAPRFPKDARGNGF